MSTFTDSSDLRLSQTQLTQPRRDEIGDADGDIDIEFTIADVDRVVSSLLSDINSDFLTMPSENRKRKSKEIQSEGLKK
ncbi:hypothetical protein ZOSMA_594G00010 [Zostera marina]|uniref:Uncharacterized protein n=1 Tax=Zostera marina TaxID=29655 RepID=A0A0K9NWV6_ZOSMR|nr:hypothetical protein ZOSMA_594G00010 [Zostera marina]